MKRRVVLVTALLGGISSGSQAHHSFAMFDQQKTVIITGTVRKFEWTNPHVWLELVGDDGEPKWGLEGGPPSILARSGFAKDLLTPGMKISVTINPLKNGSHGGSLLRVTLPDGRVLNSDPNAISNTGATAPGDK